MTRCRGRVAGEERSQAARPRPRLGDPKRMAPVKLEVVRHGEVIQAAESRDPNKVEATLDFTVGPATAAGSRPAPAGDGTSAHTTPVYVIPTACASGIRQPGSSACEAGGEPEQIEGIIADARKLDTEGKVENDRYRKLLAQQGDALLERVTIARNIYADLRRTASRNAASAVQFSDAPSANRIERIRSNLLSSAAALLKYGHEC